MYAIEAQTKFTPTGGELIARFDAGPEPAASEPPAESRFQRELATALEEIVREPTDKRVSRESSSDQDSGSSPEPPDDTSKEGLLSALAHAIEENDESDDDGGSKRVRRAKSDQKSAGRTDRNDRSGEGEDPKSTKSSLGFGGRKVAPASLQEEPATRFQSSQTKAQGSEGARGANSGPTIGRSETAQKASIARTLSSADTDADGGRTTKSTTSEAAPLSSQGGDSSKTTVSAERLHDRGRRTEKGTEEPIEDLEVVDDTEIVPPVANRVYVPEGEKAAEADSATMTGDAKAKSGAVERSVHLGEDTRPQRHEGTEVGSSDNAAEQKGTEGKQDGKTSDHFDRETPRGDPKGAARKESTPERGSIVELDVRNDRVSSDVSTERQGSDPGVNRFGSIEGRAADSGQSGQPAKASLDSLSRQLRGPLPGDIVTNARIVLRGNDSGEVRLSLHPEELGRVRVQLQMRENVLSGRIVVDNAAVREIFEQNLQQLVRAFQDSGWETDSIDVSVSDGGTGGEADERQPRSRRGQTEIRERVSEQWSSIEERGLVDLMA